MPPDNVSNGEMKCFFCHDGKETPINLTFAEYTPEDLLKEINDAMNLIYDAPKCPIPTHVVTADLRCNPKKIKDFILDAQTQLDSRAEARVKYRNYKIPRRRRMILKAAKMNRRKFYLLCLPPPIQIGMEFFYPKRRQINDDAD